MVLSRKSFGNNALELVSNSASFVSQNKKTKTKKHEIVLAASFFIFISFPALYYYLGLIIGPSLAHILLLVLCYFPLISIVLFKAKFKAQLLFLIIMTLLFSYYALVGGGFEYYGESYALSSMFSFFSGATGYFVIVSQKNDSFLKNAIKLSVIILSIFYISTFDPTSPDTLEYGYDMYFGYKILLPALFSLLFAFEKKNRMILPRMAFWISIFAFDMYYLIAYGSRGPLICLFLFVLLSFLRFFVFTKKITHKKKIITLCLLTIVAIFAFINLSKITDAIGTLFEKNGIHSRTLTRILNGSLSFDNGRNALTMLALNNLSILGHGPFSDQFLFGEGNYCHNFAVELLFDFGPIGGSLALMAFVIAVVAVFHYCHDSSLFGVFEVFLAYSMGRLMVSGTFWTETCFWMLIGLMIVLLSKRKRRT